jgi:hypothetical protein
LPDRRIDEAAIKRLPRLRHDDEAVAGIPESLIDAVPNLRNSGGIVDNGVATPTPLADQLGTVAAVDEGRRTRAPSALDRAPARHHRAQDTIDIAPMEPRMARARVVVDHQHSWPALNEPEMMAIAGDGSDDRLTAQLALGDNPSFGPSCDSVRQGLIGFEPVNEVDQTLNPRHLDNARPALEYLCCGTCGEPLILGQTKFLSGRANRILDEG